MASEQAHYFTNDPQISKSRKEITARIEGREYTLVTSSHVFSGDHIDLGTRVLLAKAPPVPQSGNLLDLGCGWGPIALTMALQSPEATIWAVDVNEQALALTLENASRLGLTNVRACLPDQVPAEIRFSGLLSNPPIRIGKTALHELMTLWLPRLDEHALAHLVVSKNLGADSLMQWLREHLPQFSFDKIGSAKGFRIIEVGHVADAS